CRKNSCHDRIIIKQPENQNNGQHHHTKYEVNHVPLANKSWIVWIFFLIKVKKIYTKRGRQRCQRGIRGGKSGRDRKSTRLNSSHVKISYAVFCLKKKKKR